ncbi:MAG: hypothetical protein P9L99_11385 [Candidatus Lernaella stagnicola]|nr:hypothetical protein [Candidatus Lernaella stagnicola]
MSQIRPTPRNSVTDTAGWTVAHEAVARFESAALQPLDKPEIYSLALPAGATVAHIAVQQHELAALKALKNKKTYSLMVLQGVTVAHIAAANHTPAAEFVLSRPGVPASEIQQTILKYYNSVASEQS